MEPKPKRSATRSFLAYSHMGLQLGATVGLGTWAGYWMDDRWVSSPWGVVAGAVVGAGVGLTVFLLEIQRLPGEGPRHDP